jgi:hypothetical protein
VTQPSAETIHELLPSRTAQKNFTAAQQALRYVHAQLPRRERYRRRQPQLDVDRRGFPLWILGRLEQIWQITGESEAVQHSIADTPMELLAHRLAREAEQRGMGSPAERAIVAFAYLMRLGLRPLDYMHTSGREHAFVVIGRTPPVADGHREHLEDEQRGEIPTAPEASVIELTPEAWGVDAVVCDPWRGVTYRQVELVNTEYYYDYYPCESQLHVPPTAEAAFDG